MRALTLGLLLVLPLAAQERTELEQCIEAWRSANPATRDAATRRAAAAVRRDLAVLMEAMEDQDPEVRRRARQLLRSLVPDDALDVEDRKEQVTVEIVMQAARQAQIAQVVQVRLRQQQVQRQFREEQRARADEIARAAEESLGIAARPTVHAGHFSGGALVLRVEEGTAAARLGLLPGDVIVQVGAKRVASPLELSRAVGTNPDWSKVELTIVRGEADPRVLKLPAAR